MSLLVNSLLKVHLDIMDHAFVASYLKCTWKSKSLVKSCCFFVKRSNSCSFTCCVISLAINWRCRSPEISHEKYQGSIKIKHGWTPKENGLKKVPKKPGVFQDPILPCHPSRDMPSPESPPKSTKSTRVTTGLGPNHFPLRDGSPEKTLSTCAACRKIL